VPEDVSVVGIDDVPAARYLRPALTTIAPDFDRTAADAVTMLIREITDPGRTELILPDREPPLIVRESSAPPRR